MQSEVLPMYLPPPPSAICTKFRVRLKLVKYSLSRHGVLGRAPDTGSGGGQPAVAPGLRWRTIPPGLG